MDYIHIKNKIRRDQAMTFVVKVCVLYFHSILCMIEW